jgi:hypothetical protein
MTSTSGYLWLTSLSGIALVSLILYNRKRKEAFRCGGNVTFVHIKTARDFIEQDKDSYVQNMSLPDLRARSVKTITEYIEKSSADIIPFSSYQKAIIYKNLELANDYLQRTRHYFIDPSLLQKIPWKFILTKGFYEQGLPHTRGPYIFLSSDFFNTSQKDQIITLIHEKIHIYQRKYKKYFQKKLLNNNYTIYGLRKDYPNSRANPDLDEYIYIHPLKYTMVSTYTSMYPKSIQDVHTDIPIYKEHPNEEIAYTIANRYTSSI